MDFRWRGRKLRDGYGKNVEVKGIGRCWSTLLICFWILVSDFWRLRRLLLTSSRVRTVRKKKTIIRNERLKIEGSERT